MAQPVGNSSAACCIQGGVTSMGHQHPPIDASTLAAITPAANAWLSLRATLANTAEGPSGGCRRRGGSVVADHGRTSPNVRNSTRLQPDLLHLISGPATGRLVRLVMTPGVSKKA